VRRYIPSNSTLFQPLQSRLVARFPCLSLSGKCKSRLQIYSSSEPVQAYIVFKYDYALIFPNFRNHLSGPCTMAFYTTPSLPRTPSDFTMNATLPSLPTELLSSWSLWRPTKQETPLTPPMSSIIERRRMQPEVRVTTTLPPIAHLDRHLSAMPPRMSSKQKIIPLCSRTIFITVTPPEEVAPQNHSLTTSRLPPINDYPSEAPSLPLDQFFESKPSIPEDTPHPVDWLDFSRTQSAHFIAEKTCEMICYLWFSSPPSQYPSTHPSNSPPYLHRPKSATTTLQLVATHTFVQFMQKLLETTQVSQSVIVLSLHYIYRLKERNCFTAGQAGSEFRITVAALMMANKFLDECV